MIGKKVKALRRVTTIGINEHDIKEEIVEITILDENEYNALFNGENEVMRKTLIDEYGREYEEITEIFPFATEEDYLDYLRKNEK